MMQTVILCVWCCRPVPVFNEALPPVWGNQRKRGNRDLRASERLFEEISVTVLEDGDGSIGKHLRVIFDGTTEVLSGIHQRKNQVEFWRKGFAPTIRQR